MRTKFELAHVVHLFGTGLLAKTKPTPLQSKVLGKIVSCRTAVLGGHEEACENCGTVRAIVTIAVATGIAQNASLPGKPSGSTT